MSTKVTIAQGDRYHLFQEIFDGSNVFLQVDGIKHICLKNGSLTFSCDPTLLTEIAVKWLGEKEAFLEGGFFDVSEEAEEALSEYLKTALKSALDDTSKS